MKAFSAAQVNYEHSGSGSLVTQTYNEPGIEKTLALGSGADPYSAMDRFGRMIDLRWNKGANQLVHLQYDYDRVSNRLFERNKVLGAGGSNPAVDNLFQFDQLNRMKDFQSGELNTAGDAIAAPELQQSLTLDETGNFKAVVVQENGSTVLNQARSHNDVNEITNITETVGSAWATPSHDTAGNMTAIPKPSDLTASYDATWDAWHRLVSLKEGATTVAGYQYDGNGRRMVKEIYGAGTLDETRHVYYSTQSQAIEERVDSSTDAEIQFVWNLGYVDDLLLRDRDTSGNGVLDERLYSLPDLRYCVMALADSSGAVVERFTYDAHGKALVMSPLFGARTGSNYDWEFRYTGRREDLETGLMYFRARYFSNDLGRFVSRDPLGFIDGVNLYRGWFVAGGMDPSGNEVLCVGLGIEFIFVMGGSYTHGFCIDECGNHAWVGFARVAAGVGGGIKGGFIYPGKDCISDLVDITAEKCSIDGTLTLGPFSCGGDSNGTITGGLGPITGSTDGGFDVSPNVSSPANNGNSGGLGIGGSVGVNALKVISRHLSKKCPCRAEPELPQPEPRAALCPKDQVKHSCEIVCAHQKWVVNQLKYDQCIDECLRRAWKSGEDPISDPYWN